MRKCFRCDCEMIENCDIKVQGGAYGITIASSEKVFADRIGKPKVAVCPDCGEVSIYIENPQKLKK